MSNQTRICTILAQYVPKHVGDELIDLMHSEFTNHFNMGYALGIKIVEPPVKESEIRYGVVAIAGTPSQLMEREAFVGEVKNNVP